MTVDRPVRHILSLSGGKDSTALAIYMKGRVPQMEYVFCDTGEELPETYQYLDQIEVLIQKPIVKLKNNRQGFADLLAARNGFLPSPQARWCTQYLKIIPFEEYVGDGSAVSYIAIRADEAHRKGYISTKPNIRARYPFIEDVVEKSDVLQILESSGLGLPSYYQWRSRSGCYFCFFQQRNEWIGLLRNHPDLFRKAAAFEKTDGDTGTRYTWVARESLEALSMAERIEQIVEETARRQAKWNGSGNGKRLLDILGDDDERIAEGCLICHL